MREPGSGVRSAFEELAAEQDVGLSHRIELGTNEAVKQGVMAKLGVAVLPRLAVRLELAAGLLEELVLPGYPLRHYYGTVYPRERFPPPVTEIGLRFISESLSEFHSHFQAPPRPLPNHGVECLPLAS